MSECEDDPRKDRPSQETVERLARMDEKLKNVDRKVELAHARLDRHSDALNGELKELASQIRALRGELEPVHAWMNKGKGALAAIVLMAGAVGGIFVYFFQEVVGKGQP